MGIQNAQQVEVNVVGSSTFGRYPKISLEKTYNMFISDDWLVNYAGFKKSMDILPAGEGRGLFNSVRGGFLIAVVSSAVYRLNTNLLPVLIGTINTNTGQVYIDENLSNQICIVDGESAYIYNYDTPSFTQQTLMNGGDTVTPNYVAYHNTFFLIGSAPTSTNPQNWYAFEYSTDSTIMLNTQFSLQTKPDTALAVLRLPGRGNHVLVLGTTVGEVWTQVGGTENYRRVSSFNIDNGVVATSTIAANDEVVCWLGQNQNNSPTIMVTDGASVKSISTDGIDYLMSIIQHPEDSNAFFFKQDGHLFYQLTFYNAQDNLSLIYDFTTKMFFHVSDENLDFHPARDVVFFNQNIYFISLNDASIYRMDTELVTYDYNINSNSTGQEIPRIRICKSIRKKDASRFRVGVFGFWLEQGVNNFYESVTCHGALITESGGDYIVTEIGDTILAESGYCIENVDRPRVDMSFSKNGNQSFSNIVSRQLNPAGVYRNQISWWRMGQANEFTVQLRFWGFQRFVANNGIAEIY